ncbi:MAG: hypothetical protein LBE25_15015 [Arthrobacter sp.]|jgi:ABC-type Na+ efflux pump permease subunit|nr:hypothetical protein [Arthrobacter sp.]
MSALPLEHAAIEPAVEPERAHRGDKNGERTPLALVRPAARRRRRWPFVLMCVLVVAAVVGTVLVLNVSVSRTQYELVSLRSQQQALAQANGTLTEEINNRRAPQNLAKQAQAESMVPGGQPGVVDLGKGTVTAVASPAAADADAAQAAKDDELNVAVPLTPAERAAAVAKKQELARAATAEANAKAAKASGASTETAADSTAGEKDAASSGKAAADPETGKGTGAADESSSGIGFTKDQLNGGTIPAPSN